MLKHPSQTHEYKMVFYCKEAQILYQLFENYIMKLFFQFVHKKFCNNITNILVTFGGTDPLNYTKLLLDFIIYLNQEVI